MKSDRFKVGEYMKPDRTKFGGYVKLDWFKLGRYVMAHRSESKRQVRPY